MTNTVGASPYLSFLSWICGTVVHACVGAVPRLLGTNEGAELSRLALVPLYYTPTQGREAGSRHD